jgi:hypothetical protein
MGYNLYIGEADLHTDIESRWARYGVAVKDGEDLGAPLNSTDNHSNCIYPSYSAWGAFCEEVGLKAVFYAEREPWWTGESGNQYEGLLSHHPGCAVITEDHYKAFVAATEGYKGTDEYHKKRLDWLVWWTRWALDNCQYPSFSNS